MVIDLFANLMDLNEQEWNINKSKYLLSHPSDILRDKISEVSKYLSKIHSSINDGESYEDKRLELVKNYIMAIDSIYDSFFLIIKSLTFSNINDNEDAIQWLKSVKPEPYISFIGSTKQQHETIRKITNKIKHAHTNIMPLTINNHNNKVVYGFYINTVIDNEHLTGPDTKIHIPYKKCSTAFSYNHFILFTLNSLDHYLTKLNAALFKSKKNKNHEFKEYTNMIKLASDIEQQFFPDEYSRVYLKIEKNSEHLSTKASYRYKKEKGEDVDKIYSVQPLLLINQRTKKSNAKFPYLQLIYPDNA